MKIEEKKMNASQRLEGLEQSLIYLDQALFNMTKQISGLSEAFIMVTKRQDAIMQLMSLTNEMVDKMVEESSAKELSVKVEDLLQKKLIEHTDIISSDSFVVAREMGQDGRVLNPRIQFPVSLLESEAQEKLLGKAKGDSIQMGDKMNIVEIQEIYKISKTDSEKSGAENA